MGYPHGLAFWRWKAPASNQPLGDAPGLQLHLRALAGIPLCLLCHEALAEQLQRECEGPGRDS